MNHKEGHELVDKCYEIIKNHINQHDNYYISMSVKSGYDDETGHFYGFEYTSKFNSKLDHHTNEQEIVSVQYFPESEEVYFYFDNNGYDEPITCEEQFIKYLVIPEPVQTFTVVLTEEDIDAIEDGIDQFNSGCEDEELSDKIQIAMGKLMKALREQK